MMKKSASLTGKQKNFHCRANNQLYSKPFFKEKQMFECNNYTYISTSVLSENYL